jgi:membrane-associated phospholipid phosphatase
MELAATQLIVSIETMLISLIPFHQRPAVERGDQSAGGGNPLNDLLRGRSSFPSGHMVGVASLMFKGWEHYGWTIGLPATAATIFIGWARVQAAQHYLADVVATVGLAGIASLAVTRTRDFWPHTDRAGGQSARLFLLPLLDPQRGTITVVGQF